jgi:tetratricopeptide (TPR) repeat protein
MIFDKLTLLCVCSVLFLLGCSTTSTKKDKPVSANEASAVDAIDGVSILPSGPVTPNPYMQNKPAVSRTAMQNFTAATQAMRNKQWAQAESLLQNVIAENNKLSGAYVNLGLVYHAQKEDKRAEQAFSDAISANHTNLDAYNQLAILQRETGNFSAAEMNYKKALSIWPFHPASHKNIAILYDLYMGKSAEALPHYEAYLELIGGQDKQVTSWIADLQRRLGVTSKPKVVAPVNISTVDSNETDEVGSE